MAFWRSNRSKYGVGQNSINYVIKCLISIANSNRLNWFLVLVVFTPGATRNSCRVAIGIAGATQLECASVEATQLDMRIGLAPEGANPETMAMGLRGYILCT